MFRPSHPALILLLLLGHTAPVCAAQTDWRDIESRIEYAWYTEDARDLSAAQTRVTDVADSEPLRNYFLALIQMHEGQVARDPAVISHATSACISSADDALAQRPTDAEVLALQSLCMDLRNRTRSLDVSFAGSRAHAQMLRAQQLAPKNPRVRLLAAEASYLAAKTRQEKTQQLATFQAAVDAFEQEREGMERTPSWGAAEAWQGLAQVYLDRGDAIAARSALEHALLLMPDYKSAHRLLNHIVG